MSNRPKIQTSQDAYKSLSHTGVKEMYAMILAALKILGSANTEKIASYLGVDHSKVHKRTSEMERLEMIWRPGAKSITKAGKQAFLWTIRGDNQPKTDNEAKKETTYKPNEPTAAEHAVNIIKQTELF